ncbi:DUF4222 domain-containing protein [Klebsiella pneumoniae]|uniref:DUF4222 domain-containing protein n=1 Tax=Klebsiella pneumoniae TaxID=573 RepID=UPI0030D2D610
MRDLILQLSKSSIYSTKPPRGVVVHVTGWDREKQQVYFTRPDYPHECMQPVWKFQQYFTRVLV